MLRPYAAAPDAPGIGVSFEWEKLRPHLVREEMID